MGTTLSIECVLHIIDNLQLLGQRWSCQQIIPAQWGPILHPGAGPRPAQATVSHRDIDVATEMFIGYFTNSDPFTSENVGENNSFVIPISDVAQ